ncbi:MAG: 2'-5' RNA ligase family protein [Patescibacteria group bacterium]
MKDNSLKEYSLWLVPDNKKLEFMAGFLNNVNKQTNTISFKPHVTLINDVKFKPEKIIKIMKQIARETAPFKITFINPVKSYEFYKSIFLRCRKSKGLMGTNNLAQKLFNKKYAYNPHMSVVYGSISDSLKDKAIRLFNSSTIKSLSFTVNSICLCRAFGAVDQWEIVNNIPLKSP